MAAIIGIDLGTTFSAVARIDEAGRPVIVHNADGSNITPSVVSFEGDSVIVGEEARKLLFFRDDVHGRFKRRMGTDQTYVARGQSHNPTSLSALVLKKLKEDAESQIGPVAEAVITIPANFANEAREATLEAARMAGLNVKYIINEPTAAALYFAHHSGGRLDGIYAVYDLGGGTFDVSIVQVSGSDVRVLSTEGVSQLGGDDFDQKLQDIVAAKYQSATGGALEPDEFSRSDAEEQKKSLSRRDSVTFRVAGAAGRENIEVTRAEFEEAISSLIAQAEMLCETAIEDAELTAQQIDAVILVGGSTRVPAVQASVARAFGKDPVSFANPDEVVTLGAALYAAYKTDKRNLNSLQEQAIRKIKISEITSKYYGTLAIMFNPARQEQQLQNVVLIKKGERIPASVTEPFATISDGQDAVDCSVTESSTPETDPKFVRIIFNGELKLPPGRPRGQEIQITFSYDANQMMHCAFLDVSSGQKTDVNLKVGGADKGSEIDIGQFLVE